MQPATHSGIADVAQLHESGIGAHGSGTQLVESRIATLELRQI